MIIIDVYIMFCFEEVKVLINLFHLHSAFVFIFLFSSSTFHFHFQLLHSVVYLIFFILFIASLYEFFEYNHIDNEYKSAFDVQ
jgi:hypothetical protein